MRRIEVHPDNPQSRLIRQVVEVLQKDGLVLYPTDSGYALGCHAESSKGLHRLYTLKKPLKKFFMALLLHDFSAATQYARIDNFSFGVMKPRVPGPFTFVLPADHRIARKLEVKRPEIGVRFPTHPFLVHLFQEFPHPLLNTAAKLEETQEISDPDELWNMFRGQIDLMVDVGEVAVQPTNIIRLVEGWPEILRGSLEIPPRA